MMPAKGEISEWINKVYEHDKNEGNNETSEKEMRKSKSVAFANAIVYLIQPLISYLFQVFVQTLKCTCSYEELRFSSLFFFQLL